MRRVREERGLTQAELADAIGIGPVQISRIERGVQEPRFATIERMAEALEVHVGAFWGSEERSMSGHHVTRSREGESHPPYLRAGRERHHRRLLALDRALEGLDHEAASAALEACIALARELAKRTGGRQSKKS